LTGCVSAVQFGDFSCEREVTRRVTTSPSRVVGRPGTDVRPASGLGSRTELDETQHQHCATPLTDQPRHYRRQDFRDIKRTIDADAVTRPVTACDISLLKWGQATRKPDDEAPRAPGVIDVSVIDAHSRLEDDPTTGTPFTSDRDRSLAINETGKPCQIGFRQIRGTTCLRAAFGRGCAQVQGDGCHGSAHYRTYVLVSK